MLKKLKKLLAYISLKSIAGLAGGLLLMGKKVHSALTPGVDEPKHPRGENLLALRSSLSEVGSFRPLGASRSEKSSDSQKISSSVIPNLIRNPGSLVANSSLDPRSPGQSGMTNNTHRDSSIENLDSKIIRIHRSTKTLFPFFRKPHNHLRSKYSWYYNWHLHPHAVKLHYSAATIALVGAFSFCLYVSLPLISHANTLQTAEITEPKLITTTINPTDNPDKFYLKDDQGNPTKPYEVTATADGTSIKTKSATDAGFQQLVLNGNDSQLYDGDKLVAQAQVKTEEKDKDGNWTSIELKKKTVAISNSPTPPNLPSGRGGTGAENSPLKVGGDGGGMIGKAIAENTSPRLDAQAGQAVVKEDKSSKVSKQDSDKVTVDNSATLENGEELKVQAEIGLVADPNLQPTTLQPTTAKTPLKKQTFSLANPSTGSGRAKTPRRLVWEVKLTDYDIQKDSSVVIPEVDIRNDNREPSNDTNLDTDNPMTQTRKQAYGNTIVDCSDYTGPMTWIERKDTDTVKIIFNEEGTTDDITIDPILTVTEPASQIVVSDGTRTWKFDTSVAGAPKYYYDTHIGGGTDNLASAFSGSTYIGPGFRHDGTVSGVIQTLVENTPTRVKVRTQGAYSITPTAIDNTYTIYPDGRAFLQYSGTTAGVTSYGFRVSQHYLNAIPEVQNHDGTNHAFVQSDTANNNYPGMAVVPFTNTEAGGASGWSTSNIAGGDYTLFLRSLANATYTGNMAIDFSNYRATTTTRDALLAEYRTPATLDFTGGKGTQTGDGFNEAEGAYTIAADASGDAQFDLTVGTPRIHPAFVITDATRTEDAYKVLIAGAVKTKGIDYNLSKPDANTVTLQLLGTYAADITDLEISDGSVSATVNKIWDGGGGADTNWSTAANWSDDAVPATTDNVMFGATSVNNCTVDAGSTPTMTSLTIAPGYTGTITVAKNMTITGDFSLEGGTFNAATFTINIGGNYSRVGGTFTAGTSTINMNATSTGKTFTAGGQTYNNITFNGVGGGWTLQDNLTASAQFALTAGTLTTNDKTLNIGAFNHVTTGTKTLNLGASQVYISGGWSTSNTNGFTLNAGTSSVFFTGASTSFLCSSSGTAVTFNNVTFNGGGTTAIQGYAAFNNLTINSTAVKTDSVSFNVNPGAISGTLTIAGNSATNRMFVASNTLSSARIITAANVSLSNVDFRDITWAGAMAGTGASTSIGDCGGNSGVNWNTAAFPTAADTETWNGSTAAWSSSNWVGGAVSRVPLPQDTVVLAGTNTVTADMPRLGKDISFSAAAKLNFVNTITTYGSVNFTGAGAFAGGGQYWIFESQVRSGIVSLTSGGKTLITSLYFQAVGATIQLQDELNIGGYNITQMNGGFDANDKNVTATFFISNSGNTRSLLLGNGTWTLTRTGSTEWNLSASGLTFNAEGSTIIISNPTTFTGGNLSYNNLSITGGGADAVTISGNNTFNNVTLNGGGAGIDYITGSNTINGAFTVGALKTATFTAGTTQTINGTFTANGTAGNIITLNSSIAGSAAILSKPSGTIVLDYASVRDIHVAPGVSQYPTQDDAHVKATTFHPATTVHSATDPAKSLTGAWVNNQWMSSYNMNTNQRFHIDLGSAKTITRIYYENAHDSGGSTLYGVNGYTLWGSNTAGDFADLTYADDGTWVPITTSASQLNRHVASNVADPQYFTVTNSTAYRYYAFKFANSRTSTYMGVRRLELQTEGASGAKWYLANTSTSVSGNFGWLTDTTPPTDPTTTTATVDGTAITASSWIKQAGTINYNFSGSTDPDSGLAGYYTYFGTNVAADPVTWQAQASDPQTYSTPITTADDGKHFYFRVKTKDAVGNIGAAVELFNFGYDITLPTRPTFIAADPPGYTTTNSFDFSWPAGTDPNGPGGSASGIKWYEYKRATALDETWSHTADASTRTVAGLEAYQEGANTFYVRTVDNADNISPTYQQVTYYFAGVAPEAPANLTVSPATSAANEFTVSWDKSATGEGDPPVVGYYYVVNPENDTPAMDNMTYVASQDDHVSIGNSPFATRQGENTIYVIGVNSEGGLDLAKVSTKTFTCQTPALPAPTNVSLFDSSIRVYEMWSLDLKWQDDEAEADSAFKRYSIERSTNGTDFTALPLPTDPAFTETEKMDTGLTNTTTYFYRVKAVDNAGKESAPSSIVSKIPTGNYLAPPAILSAPTASGIESSSATISWITDRSSSSTVRFGTKDPSAFDSAHALTAFEATSGQPDSVTSHTIPLTLLAPDTTYYYQIQSLDEFSEYNEDSAFSQTYSFTTTSAPAISATTVSNITLSAADISFDTTTVSTSSVYYGLTKAYGNQVDDISGATTTKHNVKLTNLAPGTTYHFKIKGVDLDNNLLTSDDYQFDTLPLPKVENLKVEAIPGTPKSAFKASWTTNVPTSTIIRYREASGEWKESVKSKVEIGHSIEANQLLDNTTYDIIASGRDELGNMAESEVNKFTTPFDTRPPKISDLIIETSMVGSGANTAVQVSVGFKSDEPSSAKIEYGEGTDGPYTQSTLAETGLLSERTMIISNLKSSTPYHLKAIITDQAGNTGESENRVFITNIGKKSAWDLIKDTIFNIFGFWIKNYR